LADSKIIFSHTNISFTTQPKSNHFVRLPNQPIATIVALWHIHRRQFPFSLAHQSVGNGMENKLLVEFVCGKAIRKVITSNFWPDIRFVRMALLDCGAHNATGLHQPFQMDRSNVYNQ
jgi:hypothetical protein